MREKGRPKGRPFSFDVRVFCMRATVRKGDATGANGTQAPGKDVAYRAKFCDFIL
ncbi:hypothetical protein SPIROBIBN47_100036 [uncultured spirochete]|uniref:Uncharacterized protein n=1 Tax=uncultured spirochete TaxID=156406 RepID=A0A3P3XF28_9SPIR|nr:hypothetical protein SPIROBIBN47_100036 [uncultured spirochete]